MTRTEYLKPCIQLFIPIKGNFVVQLPGTKPVIMVPRVNLHIIKIDIKKWKKPVYSVKILISEQIACAAVGYFGQVFVSLGQPIKTCCNGFY